MRCNGIMEGKQYELYDPPGSKAYDNLGDAPDQGHIHS